jgi:hypothetical protein
VDRDNDSLRVARRGPRAGDVQAAAGNRNLVARAERVDS